MNKDLLIKEQGIDAFNFISKYTGSDFESSLILKTIDVFNIEAIEANSYITIVNLNKINDIHNINKFCKSVNTKLSEHATFICCVETYTQRKKRLLKKYPFAIAHIYVFLTLCLNACSRN